MIVLVGAALLAPWLWHGVQALAESSPQWAGLARQPFHRYVNRCLLAFAILGLWPLLRSLQANSWRLIGADLPQKNLRPWLFGALFGWVSLGLATLVVILAGVRTLNPEASAARWFQQVAAALGAALVVSVLEELLFRGAVFTAVRRGASFSRAACVSGLLYAFVHFFQKPENPTVIGPWTGLQTLGAMLRGFMDLQQLIPGLLNLALAGYLLALARERTSRIWLSVGLHAGWIFWLKSYAFATLAVPGTNLWLWGTGRLYDGWLTLVLLAITGVGLDRWLKTRFPTRA